MIRTTCKAAEHTQSPLVKNGHVATVTDRQRLPKSVGRNAVNGAGKYVGPDFVLRFILFEEALSLMSQFASSISQYRGPLCGL